MRKTLHQNLQLKRRPKYALLNMNKLQATVFVAVSASLILAMLAIKVLR